jgi:hypothetical protein
MKTEFEKRDKKNKKTERFKECLDRVKDITHIEIKHKPDSLYVGVPWSGKSHYTNKSQKVVYEKDGTFTIEIV